MVGHFLLGLFVSALREGSKLGFKWPCRKHPGKEDVHEPGCQGFPMTHFPTSCRNISDLYERVLWCQLHNKGRSKQTKKYLVRIGRSLSEKAQRALRQRLYRPSPLNVFKVIALRVEGRVWPNVLMYHKGFHSSATVKCLTVR